METSTSYPARWESHAVLRDGTTVELRPIRADDRDALDAFHKRQSSESIYFRYFRHHPELTDKELDHFTVVDYRDRMAFVALIGHRLVAVARYERSKERPVAEVAFFVDDDHHGLGLATLMLEYLAAAARENGLEGFTASVLPENYGMLAVFRSAGFEAKTRYADGVIEVDLGIEVTSETSAAIVDRGRRSTARSVARLLEPRSVAVIGASRTEGNVGHELVRSLIERAVGGPLEGRIYPVTPRAHSIAGLTAYPTIADATSALAVALETETDSEVDGEPAVERPVIDLAVIAVRAELVPLIMEECAEAGVHGVLVISTGFDRWSRSGEEHRALVELARDNGMRMIGPGSFGVVNTSPDVGLAAVIHPVRAHGGSVALASESGPLGAALLERIWAAGLGVSSFVGVGDRSDVSVNDLLDYWDLDHGTSVVLLYVENYGNPRNFSAVARRASTAKPIVAISPSEPDLRELLGQSGVILVDEVAQLTDQALLAATQPEPVGNRIVVASNTASLARLATNACRRSGLEVVVPSISDRTDERAVTVADEAILIGDLDTVSLMPSSDPGDYEPIIVAAAASDEVDVVLVALAPTAYLGLERLAQVLDRVNRSVDKPVVAVGLVDAERIDVKGLPTFTFPEEAARALSRYVAYGQWRAAHRHPRPVGPTLARRGDGVVDELLAGRREARLTLISDDLARLVDELGLPLASYGVARDLDEVLALADRIGYPVVLKAGLLPRRSVGESGGTAIDLHDPEAVRAAYRRMSQALGVAMQATVVQKMVPGTGLARLDLRRDPSFGSMISIAIGGTRNEAQPPAARRFLPLDRAGVGQLVEALAEALRSDDNPTPLDEATCEAMIDLVVALDAAAAATPRLASATLNPIMLAGSATVPVDVELGLRAETSDSLAGLRHL